MAKKKSEDKLGQEAREWLEENTFEYGEKARIEEVFECVKECFEEAMAKRDTSLLASVSLIAGKMGLSRPQIQKYLSDLTKTGRLSRRRIAADRGSTMRYCLVLDGSNNE